MALSTFEIIDISLLVVLLGFIIFFLVKNKHRLSQESGLFLYKTSWGIKLINKIGSKYQKSLHFLSYISIIVGYFLMAGILYLLGSITFQYLTRPEIVETIRAPPIAPIIPYFPQLFGLSDLFPPLYAIYFIVAILIVATVHEFSHGIFARRWNVGIKSTGFAFFKYFPALFGAFVEQDDKQMTKRSKFKQLSILSAGVFANIVMTLLFFIVLILLFHSMFVPSGVVFGDYAYKQVETSTITSINGIEIEEEGINGILDSLPDEEIIEIKTVSEEGALGTKNMLSNQKDFEILILYDDAPAINSRMKGIILEFDGVEVKNIKDLQKEISKKNPGEEVSIKTKSLEEIKEYKLVLGKHSQNENLPYLGIAFFDEGGFLKNEAVHFLNAFRPSNLNIIGNTYYEPVLGSFSVFMYYLIWWVVLINLLVALFNMLPVSILDGGRFFYLTLLGVTKSEKVTKFVYGLFGYAILLIFVLLMFRWAISFF